MVSLFFPAKIRQQLNCIDFTKELEKSLNLFGVDFLAQYFIQIVAITTALFVYLVFTKLPQKPKKLLALTSIPITYYMTTFIIEFFIQNILSYCI